MWRETDSVWDIHLHNEKRYCFGNIPDTRHSFSFSQHSHILTKRAHSVLLTWRFVCVILLCLFRFVIVWFVKIWNLRVVWPTTFSHDSQLWDTKCSRISQDSRMPWNLPISTGFWNRFCNVVIHQWSLCSFSWRYFSGPPIHWLVVLLFFRFKRDNTARLKAWNRLRKWNIPTFYPYFSGRKSRDTIPRALAYALYYRQFWFCLCMWKVNWK